jgi:poly [ADP-ribose] polymerase
LSQGLRGDGIVSADGKHFVPGVFFADMATKSAGYCRQKDGQALMLLCEVELGRFELGTGSTLSRHHLGSTVHERWRDAGYIHPDFKGCKVPDIHAGTKTANGARSNLYHSEYIAQSPAQIRQRYLFHVNIRTG